MYCHRRYTQEVKRSSMTCKGLQTDYLCDGWRQRAASIRKRDGERCRGCNRSFKEVRLEVHHRAYGKSGECGSCILTGVTDNDLTTFCKDCHNAITSTRRSLRYAKTEIAGHVIEVSKPKMPVQRLRRKIDDEIIPQKPKRILISTKRQGVW